MTIDINKLRRLAQAATPGPWYATGKLTRYVEARIDGGLIQEVAACGPTKADGGYGPQQEANASLIAAANPATIFELLDRLERAEFKCLEQARLNGMGSEREAALMAKLEAAEKERDALSAELSKQQALTDAAQHIAEVAQSRANQLQAKIEHMENQEPVAWADAFGEPFRNQCEIDGVASPLYALPGAQNVPSVPDGVAEALQRLIENGAVLGPASSEDALLVARYRQRLLACAPSIPEAVMEVITGLVYEVERNICPHEETHRGGQWEICDMCGARWADDRGGKPEFKWPEVVEKARDMLAAAPEVKP